MSRGIFPVICVLFNLFIIVKFSVCSYLTSFVKFIPWYFVLFDAVVNSFGFSLFDGSTLVFRNAVDLYILILHLY